MVSGNRVVAGIVNSVKTRSYILEKRLLIQFNWCPHDKRGNLDTETQNMRGEHMETQDTCGENTAM